MMLFMSVVLPAPLRPTRPVIAPCCTCSDTPRRMRTDAIDTCKSMTRSTSVRPRGAAGDEALDVRIVEHGARRTIGDDAPVVEGKHPPGGALDDLHVVLHEEHGGSLSPDRPDDHFHHGEFFLRGNTAS